MTTENTPPTAILDWSLCVECPKCKKENDISTGKHDPDSGISIAIFNNAWVMLKGWPITCEHCGHDFTIKGVEY